MVLSAGMSAKRQSDTQYEKAESSMRASFLPPSTHMRASHSSKALRFISLTLSPSVRYISAVLPRKASEPIEVTGCESTVSGITRWHSVVPFPSVDVSGKISLRFIPTISASPFSKRS